MTYAIGRGVRVEIGITEGAAKVFTGLTLAKPPVATLTAHALTAKSIGYVSAVNIPQLVGQALRFNPVTTNDVTLEDLDGTGYGALVGTLTVIPIIAWQTLGNALDYEIGGGAANPLDVSVLLDDIAQQENGLLAAQTVNINVRSETISSAAAQRIREVAKANGYLVFRITLKDGNVRVFRGQPSLPGENLPQGAVGSGSFTVTVKGFVLEGAA